MNSRRKPTAPRSCRSRRSTPTQSAPTFGFHDALPVVASFGDQDGAQELMRRFVELGTGNLSKACALAQSMPPALMIDIAKQDRESAVQFGLLALGGALLVTELQQLAEAVDSMRRAAIAAVEARDDGASVAAEARERMLAMIQRANALADDDDVSKPRTT